MPQTSLITILTIKKIYRRPSEPQSELTLAFESRASALEAVQVHLRDPDADTTINLRTLAVIS